MNSPVTPPAAQPGVVEAAAAATGGQQQNGGQSGQGQQSAGTDKGFPENTPVADMTDAQKAAYYKHQNRQTDNKLSAFKGVTPEQIAALQQENEELKNAQLSASDKAIKEAATKAAGEAKAAADAGWSVKYLTSELKSLAASVITDKEQLAAFMAVTDPAKFAGNGGEIDEEKVMGHLTALFGGAANKNGQQQPNGQQRAWGQHSGGTGTPLKPGEAGMAAAAKRFGTQTK